jgi:hypothetical protein
MSEQATLDVRPPDLATARAVGERAAHLATDKAERQSPGFSERAESAILDKLAAGPASGEDLTDHVEREVGFEDGRCLGSLYRSLRLRGLIRIVATCDRRKGHGTGGGKVYEGCFTYEAQKAAWLAAHPDATGEQIERACQAIAERLGV